MKKYLYLLFAVLLAVLLLTACAGDKNSNADGVSAILPVSLTDVSATDVSGSDVSSTDADWYAKLNETEREIADVVVSCSDAFNAMDKSAYMSFIDPQSESYAETKKYLNYIFKRYELTTTIDCVQPVEVSEGSATVRVTQTTVLSGKCPEGKSFADAQTVLLYTMVKRDGAWYISSTIVESRRELVSGWSTLVEFANGEVSGSDSAVSGSDNAE